MPYITTKPFGVLDQDCHGRPEGAAVTHSADELKLVLLELLSRSPPETEAAARQFCGDVVLSHRKIRWQPFDRHHKTLTMTLAGGQEAQHALEILPFGN